MRGTRYVRVELMGAMRNWCRILVGHLNREGYLQDLFLDGSIILKRN
jgi:hypothetical protein